MLPMEDDMDIDTGGDGTEVEVTDLVKSQETVEKELKDTKTSVDDNNEKLSSY